MSPPHPVVMERKDTERGGGESETHPLDFTVLAEMELPGN
jgi:hypothetical protein